jgi:hypothetical protein
MPNEAWSPQSSDSRVHNVFSPRQTAVGVLQLFIFVTMAQLTRHAAIATLVFLIPLRSTFASVLVIRFIHECLPWRSTHGQKKMPFLMAFSVWPEATILAENRAKY